MTAAAELDAMIDELTLTPVANLVATTLLALDEADLAASAGGPRPARHHARWV